MPEHGSTAEMELSDAPDPIPVLSTDALPGGTSVGVVPMELDTADSKRSVDEACIEVTLSEDRQPVPNGMRTAHKDTDLERPIMRDVAGHVVEASDEVVGSQPAEKAVQLFSFEIAYNRAVSMFARGRDASVDHSGEFLIDYPTVNICHIVVLY